MLVSLFSKYSTSRGRNSVLAVRGGQEEGEARTRPGILNHGHIFHLKKIRDTKGTFQAKMGTIGEGTGNPLQCSCLENPMDRGAWCAAVYGVAHNWGDLAAAANCQTKLSDTSEYYKSLEKDFFFTLNKCHLLYNLFNTK